jgi:hypothetical protein
LRPFSDCARFHHLPERARLRLEQWSLGGYFDGLIYLSDFQGDVNSQSAFDLHDNRLARELLEAGLLPLQLIAAGQNVDNRIIARRLGLYATRFSGIEVRQSDAGVAHYSAAGIDYGSGDRSVYVLAQAYARRKGQNEYSR